MAESAEQVDPKPQTERTYAEVTKTQQDGYLRQIEQLRQNQELQKSRRFRIVCESKIGALPHGRCFRFDSSSKALLKDFLVEAFDIDASDASTATIVSKGQSGLKQYEIGNGELDTLDIISLFISDWFDKNKASYTGVESVAITLLFDFLTYDIVHIVIDALTNPSAIEPFMLLRLDGFALSTQTNDSCHKSICIAYEYEINHRLIRMMSRERIKAMQMDMKGMPLKAEEKLALGIKSPKVWCHIANKLSENSGQNAALDYYLKAESAFNNKMLTGELNDGDKQFYSELCEKLGDIYSNKQSPISAEHFYEKADYISDNIESIAKRKDKANASFTSFDDYSDYTVFQKLLSLRYDISAENIRGMAICDHNSGECRHITDEKEAWEYDFLCQEKESNDVYYSGYISLDGKGTLVFSASSSEDDTINFMVCSRPSHSYHGVSLGQYEMFDVLGEAEVHSYSFCPNNTVSSESFQALREDAAQRYIDGKPMAEIMKDTLGSNYLAHKLAYEAFTSILTENSDTKIVKLALSYIKFKAEAIKGNEDNFDAMCREKVALHLSHFLMSQNTPHKAINMLRASHTQNEDLVSSYCLSLKLANDFRWHKENLRLFEKVDSFSEAFTKELLSQSLIYSYMARNELKDAKRIAGKLMCSPNEQTRARGANLMQSIINIEPKD